LNFRTFELYRPSPCKAWKSEREEIGKVLDVMEIDKRGKNRRPALMARSGSSSSLASSPVTPPVADAATATAMSANQGMEIVAGMERQLEELAMLCED